MKNTDCNRPHDAQHNSEPIVGVIVFNEAELTKLSDGRQLPLVEFLYQEGSGRSYRVPIQNLRRFFKRETDPDLLGAVGLVVLDLIEQNLRCQLGSERPDADWEPKPPHWSNNEDE